MNIRRRLSEFLVSIQLEPKAGFVFVEGPSDRLILEHFLEYAGLDDWAVYESGQIDFEADESDGGNRSRVVRVSKEVASDTKNVICIVDHDLDIFVGSPNQTNILRYTDFACLSLYGLEPDNFHNVIGKFLNVKVPAQLISGTIALARFIFFLRRAKQIREAAIALPDPRKYLELRKGSKSALQASLGKLASILHQHVALTDLDENELSVLLHQSEQVQESRLYINDHDWAKLVSTALRLFKGSIRLHPDDVLGVLRSHILPEKCSGFPLFQYINTVGSNLRASQV